VARPMYIQICDDLRRQIESGTLAPGAQLPTESELVEKYGASRNTVREAVKLLAQQHLLESRPGQGTFVTKAITPFITTLSTAPETALERGAAEGSTYPALVWEEGRDARVSVPRVEMRKCPPRIAELLRLEESERVISRFQERLIDDTVWSLQTSYYPRKWAEQGAEGLLDPEDIPDGAVNHLAATIGLRQVGYRDELMARPPDDTEQTIFNLPHNHTVIEVCRTSFAEDETPIRVTITVFPSDRNRLVYEIGAVPGRD
jgi:GntR family transcriptional regulator